MTTANAATNNVSGTWIVPTVTGTSTAYSAVWVGIDGFSSSTVEQIGTEQDVLVTRTRHGTTVTTSYSAWYEMYPAYPVTISSASKPVKPGDTISASVNYSGSSFTLTLTDVNENWSYTTSQSLSSAQRNSAEWVVEAPSSMFGVLPLADFHSVNFTSGTAAIGGGASAPINSLNNQSITMVTSKGIVKAAPSFLSGGGSFGATWYHQ